MHEFQLYAKHDPGHILLLFLASRLGDDCSSPRLNQRKVNSAAGVLVVMCLARPATEIIPRLDAQRYAISMLGDVLAGRVSPHGIVPKAVWQTVPN